MNKDLSSGKVNKKLVLTDRNQSLPPVVLFHHQHRLQNTTASSRTRVRTGHCCGPTKKIKVMFSRGLCLLPSVIKILRWEKHPGLKCQEIFFFASWRNENETKVNVAVVNQAGISSLFLLHVWLCVFKVNKVSLNNDFPGQCHISEWRRNVKSGSYVWRKGAKNWWDLILYIIKVPSRLISSYFKLYKRLFVFTNVIVAAMMNCSTRVRCARIRGMTVLWSCKSLVFMTFDGVERAAP